MMQMIDIFIIKENKFVINWKEIFQVPEFSRLQNVPQNPMWHFENWVSTHTMYVTNYAMEIFGNDISVYLNKIMVLSMLTRLRQICISPSLVVDNDLESEKINYCLDMVDNLINTYHKVLIFSQFVSSLDIIQNELSKRGI